MVSFSKAVPFVRDRLNKNLRTSPWHRILQLDQKNLKKKDQSPSQRRIQNLKENQSPSQRRNLNLKKN